MTRVLLSAVLTMFLLVHGAATAFAGLESETKWWKVLTASLCNDKHEYVVMQQDHPGPYYVFDKIRATWDPQTKEALEEAEGGKASSSGRSGSVRPTPGATQPQPPAAPTWRARRPVQPTSFPTT